MPCEQLAPFGADATGGQRRRCRTLPGSGRNRQPAVQHLVAVASSSAGRPGSSTAEVRLSAPGQEDEEGLETKLLEEDAREEDDLFTPVELLHSQTGSDTVRAGLDVRGAPPFQVAGYPMPRPVTAPRQPDPPPLTGGWQSDGG